MTSALLAAVALAASGDVIEFHRDCPQYVARYKALLLDRAHRDAEAAADVGSPPPPPLHIQDATARVETRVERSCLVANRSQYECVVQAERYEDLPSCRLEALPVLDAAQRRAPPLPPPPPTPEERAQATKSFQREWVTRGAADVEALGTGTGSGGAPAEPPPAAAASGE
jgi:hypothetical protein